MARRRRPRCPPGRWSRPVRARSRGGRQARRSRSAALAGSRAATWSWPTRPRRTTWDAERLPSSAPTTAADRSAGRTIRRWHHPAETLHPSCKIPCSRQRAIALHLSGNTVLGGRVMETGPPRSVRAPAYLSRTHVPFTDDRHAGPPLAARAHAGRPFHGHRVRNPGRGHVRRAAPAAGRACPRSRAPASPRARPSFAPTPQRGSAPARPGLHGPGPAPGGSAARGPAGLTGLTRQLRRHPFWEDGPAGESGRQVFPRLRAAHGRPGVVGRLAGASSPRAAHGRLVRERHTMNRRRPTLPDPCGSSTIGAVGLNCSVRNGKRCFPHASATELGETSPSGRALKAAQPSNKRDREMIRQALDPLVPVSFERYRPSRSGLSTWWSTRGLTHSRWWESSSRGRLPA